MIINKLFGESWLKVICNIVNILFVTFASVTYWYIVRKIIQYD